MSSETKTITFDPYDTKPPPKDWKVQGKTVYVPFNEAPDNTIICIKGPCKVITLSGQISESKGDVTLAGQVSESKALAGGGRVTVR